MKYIYLILIWGYWGCKEELDIKNIKIDKSNQYFLSKSNSQCPEVNYCIVNLKSMEDSILYKDTCLDISYLSCLKCDLYFHKGDSASFLKQRIAEFQNLKNLNKFMKDRLKMKEFQSSKDLAYLLEVANFSRNDNILYNTYVSYLPDEWNLVLDEFSEKRYSISLNTGAMHRVHKNSYKEIKGIISNILTQHNSDTLYYFHIKDNKERNFFSLYETYVVMYSQFYDKDGFVQVKKEFLNPKALLVNQSYE